MKENLKKDGMKLSIQYQIKVWYNRYQTARIVSGWEAEDIVGRATRVWESVVTRTVDLC